MNKAYTLIYILILVLAMFSGIQVGGNVISCSYISGNPIIYVDGETGNVLDVGPGIEIQLNLSNVIIANTAEVFVWFAKTGDAAIGDDDVAFLGNIPVIYINDTTPTTVQATVYPPFNKYIGSTLEIKVGNKWINFTLPPILPYGEAFYIKLTGVRPELRNSTVIAASVSLNRFNVTKTYVEATTFGNDLVVVPDENICIKAYAAEVGRKYNITVDGETLETVVGGIYTEPASDVNPEWIWTGFEYSFPAPDKGLAYPDIEANITIAVLGTGFEINVTQLPRKVEVDGVSIAHKNGTPTEPVHVFGVMMDVDIKVSNFPSNGTIAIKMNETELASNVPLDENGSIDFTVTIPRLTAGWYNFTITDNHGFVYWFIVEIVIPYILVSPTELHVGENLTLTFHGLDGYLGRNINVWIQVNSTHYYLLDNFTVTETDFTKTYPLPPASKGAKNICVTRDIRGEPEYTTTDVTRYNLSDNTVKNITVLSSLKVEPQSIVNDCSTVYIIGTGLHENHFYDVWIDNRFYIKARSDGRGNLRVPFFAVGFVTGQHIVALKEENGEIVVKATFTVEGATLDDVLRALEEIKDNVTVIKADVDTIKELISNLGDKIDTLELKLSSVNKSLAQLIVKVGDEIVANITTDLENLLEVLKEIKDNVTVIKADVDTIKELISNLGDKIDTLELKLSSVNESLAQLVLKKGDDVIAVITTKLEELKPIVVEIRGDVATINTTIGEVKASISDLVDGQAEIKSLIETKCGEIVAVIETKAGEILAKLGAVDELISAGVKVDTEAILGIINDIKGKIEVLDSIKSMADEVKAGQDKVVDTVEELEDDVSVLTTYGLANIGLGILILILVMASLARRRG